MTLSRRQFIAGVGGVAGVSLLAPIVARTGVAFGATAADPALAARRRLVVIYQFGGNDGLNTVVPRGDVPGAARYSVYRKVRSSIGYTPEATLPLQLGPDVDHALGLNPKLKTVHKLYTQGRVAVVQGVDYPKHSYSHFTSRDIWQSGEPDRAPESGWLGRHVDRAGMSEAELRAVGIGNELPLTLMGRVQQGMEIVSIPATRFADGANAVATSRHQALARFGEYPADEPLRHRVGAVADTTVTMVDALRAAKVPPTTGDALANSLITARLLLEQPLGVEVVFLVQGGYDNHVNQRAAQETLLANLDAGLEVFWEGTHRGTKVLEPMSPSLAQRTMVMTFSEFGRRIGENGAGAAAGTDHGAAAPLFLIGGPGTNLVPGIHGDHPNMGTVAAPADNLLMTTDLRRVYQSVLTSWLGDPDPMYGKGQQPLPGLFR